MIGNFFESLLFMSAACAVLAVVGALWMRNRAILLAGSLLTWPLLMAAIDYHKQWDARISTLMPVLMSNYWIHIHVPTIIMSYAALGLAFVLGHVYLLTWMINSGARETLRDVSRSIFVMMPVGEVLLAVGIVLGGIWADASWGRFWGWDPKETWSFVTFMVFIVVIHGRWAGWLTNFGTAMGTLVGGWFLFWTYWGANFVQKGTLHSYAGAEASVEWPKRLVALGAIEALFVVAVMATWFARGGRFRFGSGHQPGDRALRAQKPEKPAGAGASGGN
jgi:ABC-type transport system involved in cytochrome c biogenesis permease subunit